MLKDKVLVLAEIHIMSNVIAQFAFQPQKDVSKTACPVPGGLTLIQNKVQLQPWSNTTEAAN